jgi:hypothetical protein
MCQTQLCLPITIGWVAIFNFMIHYIAQPYHRLIINLTLDNWRHILQKQLGTCHWTTWSVYSKLIKYVSFTWTSIFSSLSSFRNLHSIPISLKLGDLISSFKLWLITFVVVLSWYKPLAVKVCPLNHVPDTSICNKILFGYNYNLITC